MIFGAGSELSMRAVPAFLPVCFLLCLLTLTANAQRTYFSTGFEFSIEPEGLIEAVDINGATGQVGLWSGDDFPEAAADGAFAGGFIGGESIGFVDNPHGGRMLMLDRPLDDAVHFMNLSQTISTNGASVSFTTGLGKTGIGGGADYDLFGLDAAGNESFRIRIGANSDTQRLGYVNSGGSPVFDLPTVSGVDNANDLSAASQPLAVGDDLANITLSLGSDGYSVDFRSLNASARYTTDLLPYSGNATQLSRVGLEYNGDESFGIAQSSFYLDNVLVSDGAEPELDSLSGFVNGDGRIVLVGTGQQILGIDFTSAANLLVPISDGNAFPFQFALANDPGQVVVGNFGSAVTVDGQLVTTIGYSGSNPAGDLVAIWGDTDTIERPLVITGGGVSLDCNGDGVVDANDLACACTAGTIGSVLSTLGSVEADLDLNGDVGFSDFLILSSNFNQAGDYLDGDLDCSGGVDFADFLTFSRNFGRTAESRRPRGAASTVPEPSSALLLIGVAVCLCGRRRRR